MTKRQKRLQKIRQNPSNVAFEELAQILEDYQFTRRKGKGSHFFFDLVLYGKEWRLVVPYKRPHVKVAYVKKALKIIDELIELQDKQDE